MSVVPPPRTPITPTVVVGVGLFVGLVGLVMLLLGFGGVAPLQLKVPGVGVDVQTTSASIAVMVIGFATAVIPLALAIWGSAKRGNGTDVGSIFRKSSGSSLPQENKADRDT